MTMYIRLKGDHSIFDRVDDGWVSPGPEKGAYDIIIYSSGSIKDKIRGGRRGGIHDLRALVMLSSHPEVSMA